QECLDEPASQASGTWFAPRARVVRSEQPLNHVDCGGGFRRCEQDGAAASRARAALRGVSFSVQPGEGITRRLLSGTAFAQGRPQRAEEEVRSGQLAYHTLAESPSHARDSARSPDPAAAGLETPV